MGNMFAPLLPRKILPGLGGLTLSIFMNNLGGIMFLNQEILGTERRFLPLKIS